MSMVEGLERPMYLHDEVRETIEWILNMPPSQDPHNSRFVAIAMCANLSHIPVNVADLVANDRLFAPMIRLVLKDNGMEKNQLCAFMALSNLSIDASSHSDRSILDKILNSGALPGLVEQIRLAGPDVEAWEVDEPSQNSKGCFALIVLCSLCRAEGRGHFGIGQKLGFEIGTFLPDLHRVALHEAVAVLAADTDLR